jgi:hypothetical protein
MKPILLFLLVGLALPVNATVTAVKYWRMGENDPGATNMASCTNTTEYLTELTMSNTPAAGVYPYYSTNVASAAGNVDGSKLCLHYSGGQYGTVAPMPNLASNFGVELWVNPDNITTNESLVFNGNSSTTGWGLYQYGGSFGALLGGKLEFGAFPVVTNAWTHLALVIQSNQSFFYANGVLEGATSNSPSPTGASDVFRMAANLLGGERFNGYVDEVRVFTFSPGTFSTNDLLLHTSNAPPAPQVLFSTFGTNYYVTSADDAAQGVSSSFYAAEPFTNQATAALGQIIVPVYCFNTPNQIRFTLTTSSNNAPGSTLETWSISNLYTGLSETDPAIMIRVLPSIKHPVLTNGVAYWLYASRDDSNTNNNSWWVVNVYNGSDPRGAKYSTNGGASWYLPPDEGIQPAYELDTGSNALITSITNSSKTNLTLTAADGIAYLAYVTLKATNLTQPIQTWQPVFTNILTNYGSFTIPLTNAVSSSNSPQGYYILRTQ